MNTGVQGILSSALLCPDQPAMTPSRFSSAAFGLLLSSLVSSQWTVLNTGSANDFLCITRAPDGDLYAPNIQMRNSSNNGDTWTFWNMTVGGSTLSMTINDIHFTTPTVGYIVGSTVANNAFRLLRTTNGGTTWTILYDDNTSAWPRFLKDLEFINDQVGFAVGARGRMLKTTNGGANWNQLTSPTTEEISKLRFLNEQVGLMAARTALWRTIDGGNTWTVVHADDGIRATCFGPGNSAFAADHDSFLASTDQGLTWTSHPLPINAPYDFLALDQETVLAADPSGLFRTTNAGGYWEEYTSIPSGTYHEFEFSAPSTVFVAGESGRIVRSTSGGGPGTPVANIVLDQFAQCGSTILSLAAPIGDGLSYTWIVNGSVAGTTQALELEFTTTTEVQLELTVDNGTLSGSRTLNTVVLVTQAISADAGPDVLLCSGNTGTLQGSGNGSYSWSPATGLSSATSPSPTVQATGPTTYTLTVTNGPCIATDEVFVDVEPEQFPDTWDTLLVQDQSDRAQGIRFHDDERGVYVSNNVLYHTENGGMDWTSYAVNNVGISPRRISYVTPQVGYAPIGYNVRKTTDGWASNAISLSSGTNTTMIGTYFLNVDTGIAWGNSGTSTDVAKRIWRTLNGGASWQQIYLQSGGSTGLDDALMISADTIIAVGGYSGTARVWRTTNGGIDWTVSDLLDGPNRLGAITIGPNGDLFTVGGARLYRSIDQGATWTSKPIIGSLFSFDYEDIHFTHPDTAYIGAPTYKTVNMGDCWERIDDTGPVIEMFSQAANGSLFALAKIGTNHMMVLRRSGTDFTVATDGAADHDALSTCWPNPAMDHLFVRLPGDVNMRSVQVLDALGRVMPVSAGQSGAVDVVHMDVSMLRTGTYFVRVSGENGEQVIRWLKQ